MSAVKLFCLLALIIAPVAIVAADIPLEDFARHAKFEDVKISPNGEYLAATSIVGDGSALGLIRLADMKIQNLGAREGAQITSFDWAGPDRVMYTIGERWGGKDRPIANGELYTVRGDGSEAVLVFGYRAGAQISTASHIKQASSDFAVGSLIAPLRDQPDYALISSYALNGSGHTDSFTGAFPEAFKIDLRDGKKTLVLTSPLRRAEFL